MEPDDPARGGAATQSRIERDPAPSHLLTALWALAVVLLGAFGQDFLLVTVGGFFGAILGLAWLVQVARVLLDREARGRLTGGAILAWMVFPATVFVVAALLLSSWPLVLRVKASESALLRLVAEVEAGRTSFAPPVRAGLFLIDGGRIEGGSVLLEWTEGWPMASEGLAYFTAGNLSRPFEGSFPGPVGLKHVVGRWWTFYFPD